MRLDALIERWRQHPRVQQLFTDVSQGTRWVDLCPEARAPLVAASFLDQPRPILILTQNHDRVLQWQARLGLCGIPTNLIRPMPSGLSVLFEDAAPESVALSDRLGALRALALGQPGVVVATVSAALERTLPGDVLTAELAEIRVGSTVDPVELVPQLKRVGYEPGDPVRIPGQFARRGGIIDIFPMGAQRPVRMELFGDEVESLRYFDPMSQRSTEPLDVLTILPSRETLLPADAEGIRALVEPSLYREMAQLDAEQSRQLEQLVEDDLKAMENRQFFDRLDLYRPLLHSESGCAVDLLGEDGWLILDEPIELEIMAQRNEEELAQALLHRAERGEIMQAHANDFLVGVEHLGNLPASIAMAQINDLPHWFPAGPEASLEAKSLRGYHGQPQALTGAMKQWVEEGLQVFVATDQPNRTQKVLSQVEIFAGAFDPEAETEPGTFWVEGNLAGGFIMPSLGSALVSDQELFGVSRLRLPQRKFSEGVPVATVLDLKPGDFVVHIQFGIGIYRGLVTRQIDGHDREFLFIEYKPPDKLFLPADQLDRIQKYLAPGDGAPKINRLSGGEWRKTVGKAREDAREMARELIRLYAERNRAHRPSYGNDTAEQAEMEHTFPWVETPSQLQAIEEVKMDMQTDYPMDRLVCGDVGFGKTEVAIRAAFKSVTAERQVAVLCPTTILSEQHYRNFKERLEPFGVRVDYLNRFRTAAERKEVLESLKTGDVQVLVGTHSLLGSEMKFKDLGLLVVDEEQKFGVKHKENLKQMRVNVDVLSMSATPIPRTLSMALMSIRPMSLINDPPPGRLPIRSYVRAYSDEVVREALLRELARGGQAYYVVHRVQGIEMIAERIRNLVPTARIGIGHGQMTERELEPVMLDFIRGDIDILISTTIVENGLDISNANTIIVENAQNFGLSQLYQLRGRVGRSDRQAYAYMLYKGSASLTENAMARLEALQEFAHLGSGYSLAFRDLQIRGAGDLLGAKQSGQMMTVGFELYAQLIESEVNFLKTVADGEAPPALDDPLRGLEPLPTVDLPAQINIPENYIEDQAQRLYAYQRMMGARSRASLDEIANELADRYGRMPASVENALRVMRLRLVAQHLGIEKVDGHQGRIRVDFYDRTVIPPRVLSLVQRQHASSYMSDRAYVWPFTGAALDAAEDCLLAFDRAWAEVEEDRASLASSSS